MPNKTIYVKDEALWERAKQLAGKEGLSGLISEALAEFVQRKEAESRGFSLHEITLQQSDGEETLKFFGRRIADRLFGRGPDSVDGVADLFVTRGGKLVLILKDATTYEAFDYRTYDTPEELVAGDVFPQVPNRWEFQEAIGDALGHKWATWID